MSGVEMFPLVLVAALVFSVPGAILGWASGLRLPWAVASSVPVSFGVFGLGAWVLGQAEIRYTWGTFLAFWLAVLVLTALWRGAFLLLGRRRRRRATTFDEDDRSERPPENAGDTENIQGRPRRSRQGGLLDPAWLLPAAGALTGMWLLIDRGLAFFRDVPGELENIVQGWDVHWHASMVRWFMDEGIADPTRQGELRNIETGNDMYYPSAWHVGAGLVGEATNLSPIAAMNLTSIVLPGMLLPLSVAMIAWKMVGRGGLTAQLAAGIGGIAVFASPVLMWIGYYVGAWPYLAAVAASGVVLALFMHVPYRPVAAFAAMLALAGMVQLHPSAVTIVVLALALWWLLYLLWAPSRKAGTLGGKVLVRLRDVGWLVLAGGVGTAILVPQLLSGTSEGEEVSSFTAFEDVTRAESWAKAFEMQTRHTDMFPDFTQTPLLWLAALGGVSLILWRRNLWAPLFWFLSAAMTANALMLFAEPWGEWLNIIGNLHYATAHRLVMPVAMFTFAAAGVGLAVLIRLISLAPVRMNDTWARVSVAVSVILGIGAGWGTAAWATRDAVIEGAEWSINAPRNDDRMVNAADIRAFDWLAEQPGAYEGTIFGEPADGHGWMYAYNGLPSVMRHYLWPNVDRASATDLLYWHPDLIGVGNHSDPEQINNVDKAALELDVNFYFVSPWSFWGFQEPRFQMIDGLWETPGVTPVYRDGNVAIFALNQAFTDAELEQMREPGNSPEELPPLPLDTEGNPVFHRPSKPDQGGADALATPGNPVSDPVPVEIPATRP